jgi:hypothetical protein
MEGVRVMAAVPSAVQPAVSSSVVPGQVANQNIGTQGRTLSEVGQAQVIPQYQQTGGAVLPTGAGNAFAEQLPMVHEGMGTLPYTEPNSAGLGDNWADPSAHGNDLGASAYYHGSYHPDIGNPWSKNTKTQSTDWVKTYLPDGTLTYVPSPRIANDVQLGNHRNLGFTYAGEGERPMYNTLAVVAPNYDPPTGGVFYPSGQYPQNWTNDGGIATTYSSPPDPQMNATPPPGGALPMGMENFYG